MVGKTRRDCSRPGLFLGTDADNMADRDRKGRQRTLRGSANGSAKVTEAEVSAMRAAHAVGGVTYQELGDQYGMTGNNVAYIVQRKSWVHVK